MARVLVRFGELSESLRILRQAIEHLPAPTASSPRRCRRGRAVRVRVGRGRPGRARRLGRGSRRTASPRARRVAVASQLAAVRPRVPEGRAHRLRVHRAQLRADARGSRSLMLAWIPRGLAKGRITTRYPARPRAPARRLSRSGRACSTPAAPIASSNGAARPARSRSTDAAALRLDRGRCIQCGECVRAAPERFAFAERYETAARTRASLVVGDVDHGDSRSRRAARSPTRLARSAARSTSDTSTPAPTAPRSGRSRRCGTPTTTSSGSGSSSPPRRGTPTCCSRPAS